MNEELSQQTLKSLRSGADKAFTSVYEENRERFINFAKKYGMDEDSMLDIYQDAYIVFHENVMTGKLKVLTSSVSSYLFSIGKYMILEKLRKQQKTVAFAVKNDVGEETVSVADFELQPNELSEQQQLLLQHFETLGEQCQKILKYFYYRGLTIDEIVEIGQYANKNVVKSQKSRCLRTLKEAIKNPKT